MVEVEEASALLGEGQAQDGELGAAWSLRWDRVGLCTAEPGH